jgi:hypothetical protein
MLEQISLVKCYRLEKYDLYSSLSIMEELLPGAGLSFLIAQSADPVAAELNNMTSKHDTNIVPSLLPK